MTPGNGRSHHRYFVILLIFCFVLSGLLLYTRYTQRVVEGWDSLAYLFAAERYANGESPDLCHPYNASIGPYFTLAGFNIQSQSSECLSLNYPPGFPLLLAGINRVLPFKTTILYAPAFFGALGIVLVYFLGKLLFDSKIGLTAAFLLMLTPTYLEFSTSLWSDVPVTILLLGGIVVLIWGYQKSNWIAQSIVGMTSASLLGWAIFSRYIAILSFIPLIFFFLVQHPLKELFGLLSLRIFAVFCIIIVFSVLFYNNTQYGGYLTTPYSKIHGWYSFPKFSWRYALPGSPVGGPSLTAMIKTIWQNYNLLNVLALTGIVSMPKPMRRFTTASLIAYLALYIIYAFPAEGINSRFISPALPYMAIAVSYGIWHTYTLLSHRTWMWRWIWSVILLFLICLPLPNVVQSIENRNNSVGAYVQWVKELAAHTESDAVILAYSYNDALFYHGHRLTMFYRRIPDKNPEEDPSSAETFETRLVSAVSDLLKKGHPVYYVVDRTPPLMDSMTILQNHFQLLPVSQTTALFRIKRFDRSI